MTEKKGSADADKNACESQGHGIDMSPTFINPLFEKPIPIFPVPFPPPIQERHPFEKGDLLVATSPPAKTLPVFDYEGRAEISDTEPRRVLNCWGGDGRWLIRFVGISGLFDAADFNLVIPLTE